MSIIIKHKLLLRSFESFHKAKYKKIRHSTEYWTVSELWDWDICEKRRILWNENIKELTECSLWKPTNCGNYISSCIIYGDDFVMPYFVCFFTSTSYDESTRQKSILLQIVKMIALQLCAAVNKMVALFIVLRFPNVCIEDLDEVVND